MSAALPTPAPRLVISSISSLDEDPPSLMIARIRDDLAGRGLYLLADVLLRAMVKVRRMEVTLDALADEAMVIEQARCEAGA